MNVLHEIKIETPIGTFNALASDTALCALEYDCPARNKLLEQRLRRWYGNPTRVAKTNAVLEKTRRWLEAYFDGKTAEEPPLDLRGTKFEEGVWKRLRQIPSGKPIAYGEMARQMGKQNAARAVGGACRRNPVAVVVPCHRVISSQGSLTGYGGGLDNKKWLLAHEDRMATSSAGKH